MARQVTLKLDHKGVGAMLKGAGVRAMIDRKSAAMERAADKASPVKVNRRVWTGHDRVRATLALPMSVEARTGALARSLDAARHG